MSAVIERAATVGAAWANAYVGLPFEKFGRGPDFFDCWGLFRLVYLQEIGIALPRFDGDGYCRSNRHATAQAEIKIRQEAADWCAIAPGDEQPFDGLLIDEVGFACHIAVVVRPGDMLNIREGADACIESYADAAWRDRIAGIYRHPLFINEHA